MEGCTHCIAIKGQRVKIKLHQLQAHITAVSSGKGFCSCYPEQTAATSYEAQTPTTVRLHTLPVARLRSADAILALRLLPELHMEFSKPLRVVYVDIKYKSCVCFG